MGRVEDADGMATYLQWRKVLYEFCASSVLVLVQYVHMMTRKGCAGQSSPTDCICYLQVDYGWNQLTETQPVSGNALNVSLCALLSQVAA